MACSCLIWCSNSLSYSKQRWVDQSWMVLLQGKNSMCRSGDTTLPVVQLLNRCLCTLHCRDHLKWRAPSSRDLWGYTTVMPLMGCHFSLYLMGLFLVLIPILQCLDTSEIRERYFSLTHLCSLFLVAHPRTRSRCKVTGYSTCINPSWRGQQARPLI